MAATRYKLPAWVWLGGGIACLAQVASEVGSGAGWLLEGCRSQEYADGRLSSVGETRVEIVRLQQNWVEREVVPGIGVVVTKDLRLCGRCNRQGSSGCWSEGGQGLFDVEPETPAC